MTESTCSPTAIDSSGRSPAQYPTACRSEASDAASRGAGHRTGGFSQTDKNAPLTRLSGASIGGWQRGGVGLCSIAGRQVTPARRDKQSARVLSYRYTSQLAASDEET